MERRHYNRWQICRAVKLRAEGAKRDWVGILHDLNFNGARISLDRKLPRERLVKVRINLTDECSLEVKVWVVWHREVMGKDIYGICFAKLTDSDKETIYNFMRQGFPDVAQKLRPHFPQSVILEDKRKEEVRMEGTTEQERRIFERIPVKLGVRLLDLIHSREMGVNTLDVSAKGLGLVSKEPLNAGDVLGLWLEMPDRKEPFHTRGSVAWTQPEGAGSYRSGVCLDRAEFMGISRIFRA